MRAKIGVGMVGFLSAAVAVVLSGHPARAWNLICGVSVDLQTANSEVKWDADSYAIQGMGTYYLAVSDLQRLQLNTDGTFVNPAPLGGDGRATDRALSYLDESVSSYEAALKIAEENGLGDEKGLGLLRSLAEQTTSLRNKMADNVLPELSDFHATTGLVMEYTAYGIELSNKHLEGGLEGHGMGGAQYRIE